MTGNMRDEQMVFNRANWHIRPTDIV